MPAKGVQVLLVDTHDTRSTPIELSVANLVVCLVYRIANNAHPQRWSAAGALHKEPTYLIALQHRRKHGAEESIPCKWLHASLQVLHRSCVGDASAADSALMPIPESCPVTRSTPETRFKPPPPHETRKLRDAMFWYGSDGLYTHLFSDGRWHGITSATGTRNKSFWFRKNPKWLNELPYQLVVTAERIDADEPMITVPRVTNAIMGREVAMLLMLELPRRGCWQVTGNYKSDSLSFVVWVD